MQKEGRLRSAGQSDKVGYPEKDTRPVNILGVQQSLTDDVYTQTSLQSQPCRNARFPSARGTAEVWRADGRYGDNNFHLVYHTLTPVS